MFSIQTMGLIFITLIFKEVLENKKATSRPVADMNYLEAEMHSSSLHQLQGPSVT